MLFSAVVLTNSGPPDWQRRLSDEAPASFVLEMAFRSALLFLLTIAARRTTGKRGLPACATPHSS